MPSETALSYFEPGLSPATTKLVFFETDPDTLAPRRLDRLGGLVPAQAGQRAGDHHGVPGQRPGRAGRRVEVRVLQRTTPAARHLLRISWCQSHREPLDAPPRRSSGPTSSTR